MKEPPEQVKQRKVLDIGGGRASHIANVLPGAITLNPSQSALPHVIGRGQALPFQSASFNQVTASFLPFNQLEGTNLTQILNESFRVLQSHGKLQILTRIGAENLATTESDCQAALKQSGFTNITLTQIADIPALPATLISAIKP